MSIRKKVSHIINLWNVCVSPSRRSINCLKWGEQTSDLIMDNSNKLSFNKYFSQCWAFFFWIGNANFSHHLHTCCFPPGTSWLKGNERFDWLSPDSYLSWGIRRQDGPDRPAAWRWLTPTLQGVFLRNAELEKMIFCGVLFSFLFCFVCLKRAKSRQKFGTSFFKFAVKVLTFKVFFRADEQKI